jgi:glycosyltransferase involved in cell wall biosynthesis
MIAILCPEFYGVHGIARYVDSFLSNRPPDHPLIYLLTGDQNITTVHYDGVEIINIPLSSNRFSLIKWSLKARLIITELFNQGCIKWVNLHFPPLIPGLFIPRNIPVVLTAHTTYLGMSGRFYETRHFDSQWSNSSLAVKNWMERRIFQNVHRVIALTEQGKQEVLTYDFKGLITVIPNGADVSKFKPNIGYIKDIDVLFSGRIERRKGSVPLVELCKRLVASKPDIRICIVGYGDDDKWVAHELLPLSSNVRLTGKVPFNDMVAYYNRSYVYASTSYYEGLPGTCLEAMSMQLPVVVWDFLFYRGLVVEGLTGYLAAPNNFSVMVIKILALLANQPLAKKMGCNGRKRLESDYNWTLLSTDVLAVFEA